MTRPKSGGSLSTIVRIAPATSGRDPVSMGFRITDLPRRSCRTLGRSDFILVPLPPARTIAWRLRFSTFSRPLCLKPKTPPVGHPAPLDHREGVHLYQIHKRFDLDVLVGGVGV